MEEQLKKIIIDKYGSIRQFAIKIDLPYTTVDSILKRGINNSNVGNVLRICKELDISLDTFLGNDGNIILGFKNDYGEPVGAYNLNEKTDFGEFEKNLNSFELNEKHKEMILEFAKDIKNNSEIEVVFDNAKFVDLDNNLIKIPVYGTIKAGVPIESQPDIIDYVEIPKSWTIGGKKYYSLKISGDSMSPKYQENDIVIFEQSNDIESYKNKDVAVMINGTESTFKKILINEQGIVLQPYNPAYDIMIYSKEEVENLPIKVIGIAREKRTKID